jgi:hypothetical protein
MEDLDEKGRGAADVFLVRRQSKKDVLKIQWEKGRGAADERNFYLYESKKVYSITFIRNA